MGLRAGTLRHRLVIQRRTATQDSVGGQSTAWTTIATVWAEISPLSGREQLAAQAVQAEITHQITVRWQPLFANPKVVASYRGLDNGRIFNISSSINQDERNRIVVLQATEGLNEG